MVENHTQDFGLFYGLVVTVMVSTISAGSSSPEPKLSDDLFAFSVLPEP